MISVLFLSLVMTYVSLSQACSLSYLRECTGADDTSCCRPLRDSSLNMEIGLRAGYFIMVRSFSYSNSVHYVAN